MSHLYLDIGAGGMGTALLDGEALPTTKIDLTLEVSQPNRAVLHCLLLSTVANVQSVQASYSVKMAAPGRLGAFVGKGKTLPAALRDLADYMEADAS